MAARYLGPYSKLEFVMMRQPLKSSGTNLARPLRIPAPIGGWNTSSSLADMAPTDAIYLDNFFPRTSDVILRKGRQKVASVPEGESVRTVLGYKGVNGQVNLFAATEKGIYDITDGGSYTTPDTPATNGEWQYTAITTLGGSFLVLCNGVDDMKLFNGVWKDLNATSVPSLTGINSKDVVNVHKFKRRLIFCKKDSLSFFYLPVDSVGGVAQEFPLGSVFNEGGYLVATTTWTIDGGNGPDDYFVAITSEGEVVVYKGSDPSSASDFGLVGLFKLAKPMSRRCFVKLASDTAVITRSAVFPLSKSLGVVEVDRRVALTSKIRRAYQEFTNAYADLYGWSLNLFADESMLIVNVPVLNYKDKGIMYSYQFVMNTMTGAWCRFTGMNAECVTTFDGKLYTGLRNIVHQAWIGDADDLATITGSAKTAFSPLRSGANKRVTMVRPIISTSGSLTIQLGLDVNYEQRQFSNGYISYLEEVSLWDQAIWNQSKWSGSGAVISSWRAIACKMGSVVSTRLRCVGKGVSMTWIETGMLVEDGGLV